MAGENGAVCPRCFDSDEQWMEWQEFARMANTRKAKFCVDCLPLYRDAMIRQGRCAYPATAFVVEQGGAIVGVRPDDPGWCSVILGRRTYTHEAVRREVVSLPSPDALKAITGRVTR